MGSVESDLFNYLHRQDRLDREAEGIERLAEELLKDTEEVKDLGGSYWNDESDEALAAVICAQTEDQLERALSKLFRIYGAWATDRAIEKVRKAN